MSKGNHLVLCWEIGANRGHVYQFGVLGKALLERGFRVSVVLKDVSFATEVFDGTPIAWYQGPSVSSIHSSSPVNHADILHMHGYADPEVLISLTTAWCNLFTLIKPSCVLTESAPTARLAASIKDIPRMNLDYGFFCPPLSNPMPALRSWEPVRQELLLNSEVRTLKVINACLDYFHLPRLDFFYEFFCSQTMYLAWPELSHFGPVENGRFLGPLKDAVRRQQDRPCSPDKKCVIYLTQCTKRALAAIYWAAMNGFESIAYLPTWSRNELKAIEEYKNVQIRFSPLDMDLELLSASCIICHGGFGTTSKAISAGVVPIMVPNQVEQFRLYKALLRHGLTPDTMHEIGFGVDLKDVTKVRAKIHLFLLADRDRPDAVSEICALLNAKLGM